MPLPSAFESELFCWRNHWKRQAGSDESISVSSLLATHTDNIFPNIRELLKILAILPMGSTEAERSFSCVQRIHTCLRSTMDDSQIWLSSPCMQTQLLSIEGSFATNLWHFFNTGFLLFCGVPSVCGVAVSNSVFSNCNILGAFWCQSLYDFLH